MKDDERDLPYHDCPELKKFRECNHVMDVCGFLKEGNTIIEAWQCNKCGVEIEIEYEE